MTLLKDKDSLGVIIARMQVPRLTESHKALISTVLSRHNNVLIILGRNPEDGLTLRNPFSVNFRSMMIRKLYRYESLLITSVDDNREDNKTWVKDTDKNIDLYKPEKDTAVLYGSRDSFIPYYLKDGGKYRCIELEEIPNISGTQLREEAIEKPLVYTEDVANAILKTIRLKDEFNSAI